MGELIRERITLNPNDFSWAKHRTPGLHLTDIIKALCLAIGQSKERPEWTDERLEPYRAQGFLWEDLFTERLQYHLQKSKGGIVGIEPTQYMRLPEIAVGLKDRGSFVIDDEMYVQIEAGAFAIPKGDVVMSPDGCAIQPFRLLEMKWTTKSVNFNPDKDRPDWGYQVLGYLEGLSRYFGPTNEVEWYVSFPCGDWHGAGVLMERWKRHYDTQEIKDNWSMLAGYVYDTVDDHPEHPWSAYV